MCPALLTPWTVAHQAPLPMEFSRQEYWSRLPFPSPWDLPNPRIKPMFPVLQIDSLPFEPPGKPIKRNKIREIDGTEQRATNFQQSGKVTQQIRKVFSTNGAETTAYLYVKKF